MKKILFLLSLLFLCSVVSAQPILLKDGSLKSDYGSQEIIKVSNHVIPKDEVYFWEGLKEACSKRLLFLKVNSLCNLSLK